MLNASGKTSENLIEGKVHDLERSQIISAFSITMDEARNIKIKKVVCDGKLADFSFENNSLRIKFPKAKANNESMSLYFLYEETYDQISKYLRREEISVPPFAAGAKAKVIISFPGYMESATLNPNVRKIGNSFVYSNVVPANGVDETIKLTPAENVWDVNVRIKLSSDKPLKNVTFTLPIFFENAGQKVDGSALTSSVNIFKQGISANNKVLKFDTEEKEILINSRAKVSTGSENSTAIMRNPNNYLKYSEQEFDLLFPLLQQIKINPKYQNLPLYAKIGRFVNEFIKYDLRYVGKMLELPQILQNPVGVCTEYATLYNALARVAGIPALTINGAACGEYDKCQGHAWNMIYYNNRWINVDATWDLMSGIVSSSHVFISDYQKGNLASIEYLDDKKKIDFKADIEMRAWQ